MAAADDLDDSDGHIRRAIPFYLLDKTSAVAHLSASRFVCRLAAIRVREQPRRFFYARGTAKEVGRIADMPAGVGQHVVGIAV
ncbi:MAG: hypothetical protein WB663_17115 [Beijerinckiaceae bacterium]